MKSFKWMLLLLCVMCLCIVSCDEKKNEENEEGASWSQFVNIEMTRCERVGYVLQIDYVMKNKQEKDLTVSISRNGYITDNNGTDYSYGVSFGENSYSDWTKATIPAKKTVEFHVKAYDFNGSNSLSAVDVNYLIKIDDDWTGYPYTKKNVKFVDKRVLNDGIQTNDTKLDYTLNSCSFEGDDLIVDFTLKNNTGKDLKDFSISRNSAQDESGTTYYNVVVKWGNGSWGDWRSVDIPMDRSVKGSIRIDDFSRSSSYVSLELTNKINNYIPSDDIVRFITIPVEK